MDFRKIIATFCIIAGISLLLLAGLLGADRIELLVSGKNVQGVVRSISIVVGENRGCSAAACSQPVVEFAGAGGERLSFRSKFGAPKAEYAPGDSVSVLYVAGRSSLAEINDPIRLWLSPGVMLTLGLFLMIAGYLYGRRRDPRPAGAPVRIKSNAWLKEHGYPMQVGVESIARTMQRGSTPRPAWQIITKGTAPRGSKVMTYRTEPLDFDPSDRVSIGDTLTVIVDPDNPGDYWIDTSDLRD